ncbi:hypothetical protein LZL87_014011 [Fusarium oxysporum]|nr:hypothetical protein LZL87_014011 [Fusarium oxysporum]
MVRDININHVLSPDYTGLQDKGILTVIVDWLEQNHAKIRGAHALGVGWEIWAQVDLGAYINTRLGARYATRVANVFDEDAFADIVVWDHGECTGKPAHLIELKCRTPKNSNKDFVAALEDDRFKLTQNTIATLYKTARKWGIGINISSDLNFNVNPIANPNINPYLKLEGLGTNWHYQLIQITPVQIYYKCFQ